MSGADASPNRVVLDLSAASNIERCVLFGKSISLLLVILLGSHAVFSLVIGNGKACLGFLVLACLFVFLYGFLKFLSRAASKPIFFAVGIILVLLFYMALTAYSTATDWINSGLWWLLSITLLLTTIRALSALRSGALDVFSAAMSYQRKWARNGSHLKFVLLQGLRRPAGLLYFAAAFASLLSISVVQEYGEKWEVTQNVKSMPYAAALVIAAWWCYRQGGRRSIAKVIGSDADLPPSFTFYLRSFLDDQAEVALESQTRSTRVLQALLGGESLDAVLGYSNILEQVAVTALWPFDPVMCIGRTAMQPLGALRFEASEKEWQATVARFCEAANRILLMISTTSGLAWEYKEVLARELHAKLVLILPPELPHQRAHRWPEGSLAAEQLMARWRDSTSGTPLADVPLSLLETAIVIRFDEDVSPILLVSRLRSAVVYSLALKVACLPTSKLKQLGELHPIKP